MTFKECFEEAIIKCADDKWLNINNAKKNFISNLLEILRPMITQSKWKEYFIIISNSSKIPYKIELRNEYHESVVILEFKLNCSRIEMKKAKSRYKVTKYTIISGDESIIEKLNTDNIIDLINNIEIEV